MKRSPDVTGQRFGHLLVLKECEKTNSAGQRFVVTRCDCGTESRMNKAALTAKGVKMCKKCGVKKGKMALRLGNVTGSLGGPRAYGGYRG